jgi:hypothetical protein
MARDSRKSKSYQYIALFDRLTKSGQEVGEAASGWECNYVRPSLFLIQVCIAMKMYFLNESYSKSPRKFLVASGTVLFASFEFFLVGQPYSKWGTDK